MNTDGFCSSEHEQIRSMDLSATDDNDDSTDFSSCSDGSEIGALHLSHTLSRNLPCFGGWSWV